MHVFIEIIRDSDAECPFDEYSERLAVFHRRYRGTHSFASPEEARRWAREEGWKVFPVYAYIHSGVILKASESGNPSTIPGTAGSSGFC